MSKVYKKRDCPICNYSENELIYNLSYNLPDSYNISNRVDIVYCVNCGFVFKDTSNDLVKLEIFSTNNNRYESFEQDFTKQYLFEEANLIKHIFDDSVSIIDIGCSTGCLLYYLKQKGFNNIIGLDPSKTSCYKAEQKGLNVVNGSIYDDYPGFNNRFNLIILSHVLEHLLDVDTAITNIKKWLSQDGYIYICLPDESLCDKFYGSISSLLCLEHLNHFGETSLDNLMLNHGFEKVSYSFRPYRTSVETIENEENIMASFDAIYKLKTDMNHNKKIIKKDTNTKESVQAALDIYNLRKIASEKKINELYLSGKHFYLWGVSHMAMNLLTDKLSNLNIEAFVDIDSSKQGMFINNIPVLSPDSVKNFSGDILVLNNTSRDSILKTIESIGLKNNIIIL